MTKLFILVAIFCLLAPGVYPQDAKEIVKTSEDKVRGKTMKGVMKIQIVRSDWQREMGVKVWLKGDDYSMILITAPPKDKGSSFLKRDKEIWNWVPSVERTIKLPPSMMTQSWMGTDFTNDDLVKESSVANDYDHSLAGSENVNGRDCYKIILTPKQEAAVVWGKVIMWIDKKDYLQMKTEFYDETGVLTNTMIGSDIKTIGGKLLPAKYEMVPADKPSQRTVLIYESLSFDEEISDSFFSVKNMQSLE
jgi:outer membrane lipoprotein-sorting protein